MTTLPTFDPGYSTPEMTEIWSAAYHTGAILEFEAALALALADAGLAPTEEAEAVAIACEQPVKDPERSLASTWETGTPLLAIVDEVKARLAGDDQRRWVHHGATSQDAIDTAQMLQARAGLALLEGSLVRIARSLLDLLEAHRSRPQMGRTFLQHARPTTFGLRVAMWLEVTLRHIQEEREARSQLAVQLGGPVGNRADFGEASEEVVRALARRLDLESPPLAWHADRSRVWKLVAAVEQPVRSMAKIAMDIALLAQSDISEVTVRAGGSSSMTGKLNPLDPLRALAAADACRGAAAMITQGRPHELDRGIGSWHVEWFALPLVFQTAAAVFEAMEHSLETLRVEDDRMESRVPLEERGVAASSAGGQFDTVLAMFDQVVGRN